MPEYSFLDRLKRAWNVFRLREESIYYTSSIGGGYGLRPDRVQLSTPVERSIIASIITRIGIDVASIPIYHVRLDQNGNFTEIISSGLNNCLTIEANIDQTGRSFIQDAAMSLCDEGAIAIVPTDTSIDPRKSSSYDILTMRTGQIIQWYPEHVLVNLYNQRRGVKEEILLHKSTVAIVENPLFSVMNESNSTLKRLITKLNLLDAIDQQSGSGKLDLIFQVPYAIKTEARRQQALRRKEDIETQLKDSQYGIAYVDTTEKVTQLNRPAENNLMSQIEYLTRMLHSQLGMTPEIFEGSADEASMLNYFNRTIEPILAAITGSMRRSFLTKTAITQGQSIMYIIDPFRLVPVSDLAEIADKFTRNEILTSNEIRGKIGFIPSKDPKADELRNKNLNEQIDKPEPVKINQNGKSNGKEVLNNARNL